MQTEILTVEELGEYLKRTPSAVRNMVMRKKVPHRKLSGRIIFFKDEIEKWLSQAPGVTLADISKQN